MQQNDKNIAKLTRILGEIAKELREKCTGKSLSKLADEYDISKSTLCKLENGIHNTRFITLWQLSEALGIKCSDLIKMLEEKLGDDFSLIEE